MNRRTALIFYVLSVYVVVQFIWWGYHLIELTNEISNESTQLSKRVIMILGEGAVFLLLLVVGIWQIHRSIRKELKLSERQKNFLLSVTHELKTPLAANKLYLQTIEKRTLTPEQQQELIQKAIEENSRLERMIDNILNASRLENNALRMERESIVLKDLAEHVAKRFNSFLNTPIITCEIQGDITLFGDRFMIETIFNNLVENALKYAGKEKPITIYGTMSNGKVIFGVKDQGPGISKEAKSEVFKKFYRIGSEDVRTQKGSGLGLFIVSQIAQLHGGLVSCKDNEPNGCNFEIQINNNGK